MRNKKNSKYESSIFSYWKYYNHAIIPNISLKETPNAELINNNLWKKYKKSFFITWTTDFDCQYETDWWYVIADVPFVLDKANKTVRYCVRKSLQFFDYKICEDGSLYLNDLYKIYIDCQNSYPKYNQHFVSKNEFSSYIQKLENENSLLLIAFNKMTGGLLDIWF